MVIRRVKDGMSVTKAETCVSEVLEADVESQASVLGAAWCISALNFNGGKNRGPSFPTLSPLVKAYILVILGEGLVSMP